MCESSPKKPCRRMHKSRRRRRRLALRKKNFEQSYPLLMYGRGENPERFLKIAEQRKLFHWLGWIRHV